MARLVWTSKRTQFKRPVREQVVRERRKTASGNKVREQNKKPIRRAKVEVDSEFAVSEAKRELGRKARELKRRFSSRFRSSSPSKTGEKDRVLSSRRNQPGNKGKEKVVEQVCGICLSEEGERKVRGSLDCCSHYFCFACIMEWSKVESRCPTCKQRFKIIRKNAIGFNLRNAEIVVPKRDQVYQPSEEELRNYIDPYENVFCKECFEGGDDELVLLCDRCDRAAHTYCVGLGVEVPDGNWYCDACKLSDLSSSNTQSLNHGVPDNLSVGSAPVAATRETFDPNCVPETPFSQLAGHSIPETHSNGNSEAISSFPGSMAVTLSERRQRQRQLQQFLIDRSRVLDRSDQITSIINPLGSQICEDVFVSPQQALTQAGTPPQSIRDHVRLPDNTPSLDKPEVASPKLFCLGEQGIVNQASASAMGKEEVLNMVKRHLKSLSRKMDIGYNTFKETARTSTHTVLAALGRDHRACEVYPLRTQPLVCTHLEGSSNRQTCLGRVQCSSCFDRFVRNAVKEVLHNRVPVGCTNQTLQKE